MNSFWLPLWPLHQPLVPVRLVQNLALGGADGVAVDRSGRLRVASNEINAVVAVTVAGAVQPIARATSSTPEAPPYATVWSRRWLTSRLELTHCQTPGDAE